MPEITNDGKLFFDKKHSQPVAYGRRRGGPGRNEAAAPVLIVREILGPKSGRRTERLAAIDVHPVAMTGHECVFIWRHDCSPPGGQTQY